MPDKIANSSVCRVNKNTNFTAMGNYHLRSTALSLKAIGLISKVLSLPDKWDYTIKGLAKICKENETAIESTLRELKELGYLKVTKLYPDQTINKKIGYKYDFYEYSEKDETVHIKPTDLITISNICGSNGSKVCRVTKNRNYTVINSLFLRSMNLSLKAIGLLCKILSLPEDWDYSINGLIAICKDGKTAVRSAMKELEEWGYLKRTRLNPHETESGRFEYIYDFNEVSDKDVPPKNDVPPKKTGDNTPSSPQNPRQDLAPREVEIQAEDNQGEENQAVEIQEVENQGVENLSIENRQQYNTQDQIPNNQILSNQLSINQSVFSPTKNVSHVEQSNDREMDGYIDEHLDYFDIVKQNINFDGFTEWLGDKEEAEEIVQMIVRCICSTKPTEHICKQEFPREVVKSALLKIDHEVIVNAIEQMQCADNIRHYESYLISTLFNEANGKHLRKNTVAKQKKDKPSYDTNEIEQRTLNKYKNLDKTEPSYNLAEIEQQSYDLYKGL